MPIATAVNGSQGMPVVATAVPFQVPVMATAVPMQGATFQAVAVTAQPIGMNIVQPPVPLVQGQWRDTVCDCCSESNSCMMAWCCACFAYASIISFLKVTLKCQQAYLSSHPF